MTPDTQWLDTLLGALVFGTVSLDDEAAAIANTKIDSVKQAILAHEAEQVRLGKVTVLEKAHRAGNTHDYDNETDEYIDEMLESLTESVK